MCIDADRINDVVVGKAFGRGCGKTTAALTMLLGEIDFGLQEARVFCCSHRSIDQLICYCSQLAVEMGFDLVISARRHELRVDGCLIRFVAGEGRELLGTNRDIMEVEAGDETSF